MSWEFYLKSLPFEFSDDFFQFINKKLKRRPISTPLLSGDTYRALADYLFDDTFECIPNQINNFCQSRIDKNRKHPLVFVSSTKLSEFQISVFPQIKIPFVLLTHQGDVNICSKEHKLLLKNKYLIHWFAQNNTIKDEKITCLPIGLEDKWKHKAGATRDFFNTKLKARKKDPNILFGFTIRTNLKSRSRCFVALCKCKYADQIYVQLTPHLYRKLLSTKMFVASPVGNGLDCHRTWEAIYLGVVPIIEDNPMNQSFKNLGLPVILINPNKWDLLEDWTPDLMTKLYNETISNGNTEAAYLPYWINEFNRYLY